MGYRWRGNADVRIRANSQPEQALQEWYDVWLSIRGILHCASLGGRKCSIGLAVKMKRAGYKKGYPDMIIEEPRGPWHGMRVELKYKNYPEPEQKKWRQELLKRQIYSVIVPANLEYQEAQEWLVAETTKYLDGKIAWDPAIVEPDHSPAPGPAKVDRRYPQ